MIRMTKLADYGLVLLTHIARHEDDLHSAVELASAARLPLPTVGKVLKILARDGLLHSNRGAKGGYKLARKATEISVAEILQALEGPIAITECLEAGHTHCEYEPGCPTQANWVVVNRAIRSALERISLAEMAQPFGQHDKQVAVPLQTVQN
ncbi:MAG: SUF system Fe-S cluster assembly regulator [Candidatus Sericytochromatia bacterium]|nr:SUF system Fe-S cluster assembly regulator [Candidatus Tanganyikabacteria bacterium]